MSIPGASDPLDAFRTALGRRVGAEADAWLEALPELIGEMTASWDLLVTGTAKDVDAFGITIPARRGDERVAMRLSYPDGWFLDQTVALQAWDGNGTVRLLEHDARGAHLRTTPDPGTPLGSERNQMRALRLAADALRALWIEPPAGLQTVTAEVRAWVGEMPARFESVHRPFERTLLHEAEQLFRAYMPTQSTKVLLHGDARLDAFVMDGDRAIALDPKPLVGEPAFDAGSLLRDRPAEIVADTTAGRALLQSRLEQLTDLLDVSASRVKGWAFAVAVDMGLLAYEAGDTAGGELMIDVARLCQSLTA
jgi:streptomycin 6-kinase